MQYRGARAGAAVRSCYVANLLVDVSDACRSRSSNANRGRGGRGGRGRGSAPYYKHHNVSYSAHHNIVPQTLANGVQGVCNAVSHESYQNYPVQGQVQGERQSTAPIKI